MRPVEKWNPENEPRINDNYPNYKDAKHPLCMNLGTICSYCEKAYDDERDLQVEHIQPKNTKMLMATISMPILKPHGVISCFPVQLATEQTTKTQKTLCMEVATCHTSTTLF